ncbi:hypothetical protein MUB24_05950 [Lederbergia sp. NSJ-179]|uniref:hypothetical protein n=1 Tax=Lederbergia sp. NSJ-179 TaxID=2931402 RepID=UPI001FD24CEB|nr:hypothetical protein [Lederbergia sp. NSJ-179]MCJ7840468.1 hypothetical protein [Lederbergia sp. NSJ-179]
MSVKTFKDIFYGPYVRNKLDAYIIENRKNPTPVLFFFHGGGYIGGDKSDLLTSDLIQECLEVGISVITCNNRINEISRIKKGRLSVD